MEHGGSWVPVKYIFIHQYVYSTPLLALFAVICPSFVCVITLCYYTYHVCDYYFDYGLASKL